MQNPLLDTPMFEPYNGLKVGDKVTMATAVKGMVIHATVIDLDKDGDSHVTVKVDSSGDEMLVRSDWCMKEQSDV